MFSRAKDPLRELERRLGRRFRRREFLERALTHRSYANEQGLGSNYERLEFLGDSVLGLATSEWLYSEHRGVSEGKLSAHKSRLVSEPILADFARDLGLGEFVRLGVGEKRSGGREKDSILSDVVESVIGAVFLDGGWKPARLLVRRMLDGVEIDADSTELKDPKGRLQEFLQGRGQDLPAYRTAAEDGPDHDKVFTVECLVEGEVEGSGEGGTKKRAEQLAAAAALERLQSPG
ncbi:MAG: ribonuclease III [Thermoanaerobaculia bacterium]